MENKDKLVTAATTGDLALVKELVQGGADVNAKDNGGFTALMKAAWRGHLDVVQYLVEQGTDVNTKGNNGDWTTLVCAAEGGHLDVARYLVDRGADVNAKSKGGWTALIGAANCGHLDVVRYLVEQVADVNSKDNGGFTALMKAASRGHLDVVRYLVQQGADKEAKDKNGDTALMKAVGEGHPDVARYLVEQGAGKETKNGFGMTALIRAALQGQLKGVQYLVDAGADKEAKDWLGHTALIPAAYQGYLDVVQYLVEQGASKEAKNIDGINALMGAAKKGHLDVARYLVEQGVDVNAKDKDGNTALGLLMSEETGEKVILPVAKLLLENGVPPLQSNNQGESAISIARTKGFHDVVNLFEEYAAKPRRPIVFHDEPEEKNPSWLISPESVIRERYPFATGSFGEVYHAQWSHIEVVQKEIRIQSEAEMSTFRREVRLWATLRHKNVVPFYGANHLEPPYFTVSSFASNGTLRKYLLREKEEHRRTVVWRKLLQVAAGLNHLHEKGIVHGDLKGDNILVGEDGTAMLTDFGLSFLDTGSRPLVERLGAMQWRAPEYATGTLTRPSFASDVYSLGMCIIEAVKGEAPWGAWYDSETLRQFLRRGEIQVEKPGEMTSKQWELVSRMIAFDRVDRPVLAEVLPALTEFALDEEMAESFRS